MVNEGAGANGWIDHAQFPLCGQLPTPGGGGVHPCVEEEGLARELTKGAAGLAAQQGLVLLEITGLHGEGGEGRRGPGEGEPFHVLWIVEEGGGKPLGSVHDES